MLLRYRVLFSLFLVFAVVLIGSGRAGSEGSAEAAAAEATVAETEQALPTPEPTGAPAPEPAEEEAVAEEESGIVDETSSSPLYIESLRTRGYPASEIVVEETLEPGSNYQRFIASYTERA